MTVTKRGPVLEGEDRLPERYFPDNYRRGVRGGLATLNSQGQVVDENGDPAGGGITADDLAVLDLPTPDPLAAGGELVNAQWVRELRLTIENLPAGSPPWPVKCWDGVQLQRSEYTDRTDIGLIYEMPEAPSFAPGYAIQGLDGWRRRYWPAT